MGTTAMQLRGKYKHDTDALKTQMQHTYYMKANTIRQNAIQIQYKRNTSAIQIESVYTCNTHNTTTIQISQPCNTIQCLLAIYNRHAP